MKLQRRFLVTSSVSKKKKNLDNPNFPTKRIYNTEAQNHVLSFKRGDLSKLFKYQ